MVQHKSSENNQTFSLATVVLLSQNPDRHTKQTSVAHEPNETEQLITEHLGCIGLCQSRSFVVSDVT